MKSKNLQNSLNDISQTLSLKENKIMLQNVIPKKEKIRPKINF